MPVNSSFGGLNLNPNKSRWFLFIFSNIFLGVFFWKSKDGFKNHPIDAEKMYGDNKKKGMKKCGCWNGGKEDTCKSEYFR